MSRRGTRARKDGKKYVLAAVAILLVCAAVVGGIAYHQLSRSEPIDPVTLCPAEGPRGHTILLVDKTDPLSFTQRQAFSVMLKALVKSEIPEGYLLSVFVLGENFKDTAEPLIELCSPGAGDGKSELTSNLKRLRVQYEQRFVKPIEDTENALVASEPSKASPILEMLQLVGINGFRKGGVRGPKRLVVMSDMLHNTPQLSMYQGNFDFKAFEQSDYGSKSQADLKDVNVELLYLMSSPKLQTRRNLAFWEQYFEKAGAKLSVVRRLEG
jgi:hypothetical protein